MSSPGRRIAPRDRAEADRARAILWSSEGRSGGVIGALLGVQADTVRQWRRRFRAGGVAALRRRPKPGKVAWKSPAALAVVQELLAGPRADRPNWTLPRLQRAVRERAGIAISTSWLSTIMRQKGSGSCRVSGWSDPGCREAG
jgi:transposase